MCECVCVCKRDVFIKDFFRIFDGINLFIKREDEGGKILFFIRIGY